MREHNKRADFRSLGTKPIGVITRGTTGHNRLRRCDRWVFHNPTLRRLITTPTPLAIDVGYGASHTTTCEWAWWLRQINPHVEVMGLEINPARVLPPREGVRFEIGGFELAGYHPHLVRAFNVLRQYDVSQVLDAWELVCSRLAPSGFFIEGTCDEIGRLATWILLDATGPQSLTLAWHPFAIDRPSEIAERLPKVLIHRNIPGEKIYDLLIELDACWDRAAGFATFGPKARWRETRKLAAATIPMTRLRSIRENQITVPWSVVDPF